MNTRKEKEKEKVKKYTIGYLIAMVVIFVIVFIGVNSPGLRTALLIATVVVFAALVFIQWKKVNAASIEEIQTGPTAKVAPIPQTKEMPKEGNIPPQTPENMIPPMAEVVPIAVPEAPLPGVVVERPVFSQTSDADEKPPISDKKPDEKV